MTWQIVFSKPAEDELTEAYAWYDQQSPGLGFRLISEIEKVIANISEMPMA